MSAVATRPRLGFVGAGWIGRQRLEAVAAAGVAEVAAVADPALPDCADSLDELLEQELDGVVIATPSALHAEQAIAALEHGLAVFCQKPLARVAAEAEQIVAVARQRDLLLGVDLSYRHTEAARRLRDAVRSGALGDVRAADLVFHNAYGPDKPWFYDPRLSGGGCLIDLGTHLVDLALWTLDWPDVLAARGRLYGDPVEELALAEVDLAGGVMVRIACSWRLSIGRDCAIEASFWGTDGAASLANVGGSYYDFTASLRRGTASEPLAEPPDAWGGRAIVAWAEALASGRGFDPGVEHVVTVARTLDEIYARGRCGS